MKHITRNIRINDESIEAALALNNESASAGIRDALILYQDSYIEKQKDYSIAALEAELKGIQLRHVVLDEKTREIAIKQGNGNMSAGIRKVLSLLKRDQDKAQEEAQTDT